MEGVFIREIDNRPETHDIMFLVEVHEEAKKNRNNFLHFLRIQAVAL